jgi:hypothetical protein
MASGVDEPEVVDHGLPMTQRKGQLSGLKGLSLGQHELDLMKA